MTDINKTIIIGRLTRDAEIKYTSAGTAIATCSIAVNASRKDQSGNWVDEVNFFDVTLFGKAAENLKAYLLKGKQIAVEGHLKQDRWEKDGQKYSKVSIQAETIQLIGSKDSTAHSSAPAAAQQPAGDYQSAGSGDDFPEDLPF